LLLHLQGNLTLASHVPPAILPYTGTGKTTVARVYAELLKELGALPAAEFVETSGADLSSGGTTKLDEQLKKLEQGGVLFLDEVRLDTVLLNSNKQQKQELARCTLVRDNVRHHASCSGTQRGAGKHQLNPCTPVHDQHGALA
jgi:ABC-type transport system involved in cytochrome bd biosynthesis fused ATPase/permease subunit